MRRSGRPRAITPLPASPLSPLETLVELLLASDLAAATVPGPEGVDGRRRWATSLAARLMRLLQALSNSDGGRDRALDDALRTSFLVGDATRAAIETNEIETGLTDLRTAVMRFYATYLA